MKIASAWSTEINSKNALRTTFEKIKNELGQPPDFVIMYASVGYNGEVLTNTFKELAPNTPLHGGTSCQGVMTAEGFHSSDNLGLGMLGFSDPNGSYGVGVAEIDGDGHAAGAAAIQAAIENAGRMGEPPHLVWLSGVPGYEEAVLSGIQDVIGGHIPIAGGSTADDTVEGHWQQYTNGNVYHNAVVVTALYPSVKTHFAFHSGYSPTPISGIVTRAEGRTIYEIDGKPAAHTYNKWTAGSIKDSLDGGNVLTKTTLHPIGRYVGKVGNMPYHRLSHPDQVGPNGELSLFSNISTGEEIILMVGTQSSLVTRAGRVAKSALDSGRITASEISGALVIYCAGCMLTVRQDMDQVASEIREALDSRPFIGTFTFGEQGCFTGGENHHGNLMISVVVFEA